jgi:hypothetical protein
MAAKDKSGPVSATRDPVAKPSLEPTNETSNSSKGLEPSLTVLPTMSKDDSTIQFGIVEELGYVTTYRRVFRSLGNVCMVISLTS